MANFKGKGSMSNVNLIVEIDPNRTYVDKKTGEIAGGYLVVQVDQSLKKPESVLSGKSEADSNPYLASQSKEHPNGGKYVGHEAPYSTSQIKAMVAAAKGDGQENASREKAFMSGEKTVIGINASLMQNTSKAIIINTKKPMTQTKNHYFGKNVLDKQAAVTAAAKEYRNLTKSKSKDAPTKEVEQSVEASAKSAEDAFGL